MLFQIVGQHHHRAVVGGNTFQCIREDIVTETGRSIRWAAFKNNTLLKGDCPTLNHAKKLCRDAAGESPSRPA